MNKITHSFNLWRLKRMMTKSARLDTRISKLGAKLDKWERENINISTQ